MMLFSGPWQVFDKSTLGMRVYFCSQFEGSVRYSGEGVVVLSHRDSQLTNNENLLFIIKLSISLGLSLLVLIT